MNAKKITRRFKHFSLKFLWPLLPAGLLIALTVFLSRSQFFTLKKINCHLDNHSCPLEFEPILVRLHGQNIFKLQSAEVILKFQAFDSTLTDIDLHKRLPNQLDIAIKRRLPIAQMVPVIDLQFQGLSSTQSATLSGQTKDQYFQVDKTGDIFNTTQQLNPHLPHLWVPESFNLSLGQSDLSQKLAELIQALEAYYVSFDVLAWIKQAIVVIKTAPGPYAIIDLDKSLNSQVASLQYILSGIKIGEKLPTKIDLRFDKPVLTY